MEVVACSRFHCMAEEVCIHCLCMVVEVYNRCLCKAEVACSHYQCILGVLEESLEEEQMLLEKQ
jgi:hypothetical protein